MNISRKQFLKNAGILMGGAKLLNRNFFSDSPIPPQCNLTCGVDLRDGYGGAGVLSYLSDETGNRKYGKANTLYNDANYEVLSTCSDIDVSFHTVNCTQSNYDDVLKYYVYYPNLSKSAYAACPLPALIMLHPEGFLIAAV